MSFNRDKACVSEIIKRCSCIQENRRYINSAEDFVSETMAAKAVIWDLEHIGETANHLSDDFFKNNHEIKKIPLKNMRNYLIHDYGHIEPLVVYKTVFTDIDNLKKLMEQVKI
jgi:uncharacterized protein with HEPN domain